MDETGFRVLGIAGSLRRASLNRGLIRAATELAPDGVKVETFDGLGEIPFFNRDVEAGESGPPEPVRSLRERIEDSDAVLMASPEYDYAIPGVLTTALDWALRPPSPMRHKPVGIIGASPANAGTARGQMVLRQIFLHAPAYVMPEPQMLIGDARSRFDGDGNLTDEETRQRLARFIVALREWSYRVGTPAITREESQA